MAGQESPGRRVAQRSTGENHGYGVREGGRAHQRQGHRLPRHLVLQPALRRRVRVQIQRRPRDLLRQAHPARLVRARGQQDVLHLGRQLRGPKPPDPHGVLLRPRDRSGPAPDHSAGQGDRRRPRQSGHQCGRGRLHLDLLEQPRHQPAVLHLPQHDPSLHRPVRVDVDRQLLLSPTMAHSGQRVAVRPCLVRRGRAQHPANDQRGRRPLVRARNTVVHRQGTL